MNKYLVFFLLVFSIIGHKGVLGQEKSSKVEIRRANYFRSDKNIRDGARRLIGNVRFWQDSTIMECDSAYFFSGKNTFEAYNNVHLYKEGDKNIDVKSDFLRYDGNTKMAYFRKNVVMRDTQVVLYTDSLDYDIENDIGYYLYGATIVDSATTLNSTKGHYYNHENTIFFKDKVEIMHNDGEYQMYTDTIRYNTISETIHFLGPTEMYNDTNYMYAEYGWYNTQKDDALFKKNAYYSNPDQSIKADSLYYDRNTEHGRGYSNVVATDTTEKVVVKGNFLEFFKLEETLLVTDSALLIHIIENDSLFLHGDTIYMTTDTSGEYRVFKAFHHAKIFKSNFQSKCDSLYFSTSDSILQFHGSPVLWAEQNQITAEYIEAYVVDNKLDRFQLFDAGLIISQQDSLHFNQIKGKEMIGYLKNNKLSRIDVFKKSETIYFPNDKEGIIGVNKSTSQDITIRLKNNDISRIIYRSGYAGALHPLDKLAPQDMKVREFQWLEDVRPLQPGDVFLWESNTKPTNKPVKKIKE